jgi:PAS domain S-box-containing protein
MEDFRELVEKSREGILVYRDGRVVYANPSCAELVGIAAEELVGAPVLTLFEASEEIRSLLTTVVDDAAAVPEAQLLHRKGRSIPVELSAPRPVRFQNEPSFSLTIRDVTERHRLRNEILRAASVERQRLAHDLHDGLAQEISGINFKARALQTVLDERLPAESPAAAEIVKHLGEALAHARHLAHGLDPAVERQSFATLLEKLALNSERLFRVSCNCQADHGVRIASPTVAQNLYRIAQEAVHNAIRHGHARHVDLGLSSDDSVLLLTVDNDGEGFSPPKSGSGMGLRTMQYRAKAMGGTCQILSRPAGGTSVQCTIPLRSCRQAG